MPGNQLGLEGAPLQLLAALLHALGLQLLGLLILLDGAVVVDAHLRPLVAGGNHPALLVDLRPVVVLLLLLAGATDET